jgi:hypothetical protein
MLDANGRVCRWYILDLVTMHVWSIYDIRVYRERVLYHIVTTFHSWFPRLEYARVSELWLCHTTLSHITNYWSNYTRAAHVVLAQEVVILPPWLDGRRPQACHSHEWRDASGASECSVRHVVTRTTQIAGHESVKMSRKYYWNKDGNTKLSWSLIGVVHIEWIKVNSPIHTKRHASILCAYDAKWHVHGSCKHACDDMHAMCHVVWLWYLSPLFRVVF